MKYNRRWVQLFVVIAIFVFTLTFVHAIQYSHTYGAGHRIVQADFDATGHVIAGKIYGVAAFIHYTDPQLQSSQNGRSVFAYIASEQFVTTNPSDTLWYIRWGWEKFYQGGNTWLNLEWNRAGSNHAARIATVPLPPPGDAFNRYSFTIIDSAPYKHDFFVNGGYYTSLTVNSGGISSPILQGYKAVAGARTYYGVERVGNSSNNQEIFYDFPYWYTKLAGGGYGWATWPTPVSDFQLLRTTVSGWENYTSTNSPSVASH